MRAALLAPLALFMVQPALAQSTLPEGVHRIAKSTLYKHFKTSFLRPGIEYSNRSDLSHLRLLEQARC